MQLGLSLKPVTLVVGCAILASSPVGLTSFDARAQSSPPPIASQANLGQILTQNANGGPQLVALIRNMAISDPTTLSAILALTPNANKDQKAAIAAGLAQAAKIVLKTNPVYANDIQQAIAKTRDQDVVLAFAAASGDQPTGATGGGAGAAGGGSGGQTSSSRNGSSGGGPLEPIGQPGVKTGNFTISSSVSGVTGPNSTSNISNSVSP